ncbi:MAG: transcriptional regulator, partial [Nitrosospira sp.]|nr:transcriptional regulator [Nitrosospira sp.]
MSSDVLIPLKRIEIVVDEDSVEKLLDLLHAANVRGYTVIKHAGGLGSRGERRPDDYALQERNALVILACDEK